MAKELGFGPGFPPRTVAIVGVSRNETMNHPGYTGTRILRMLKDSGFQGCLYPVNPKADLIQDLKVYPNLASIPEPLDLVIITVPAESVTQVLEECAEVKALNVQICTSGFGETGDEDAIRMEREIRDIALEGGLRVIGPNCMGFHVPSVRMRIFEDVSLDRGPIAFLSQSGGHVRMFLKHGADFGFGSSKIVSFGNALLMDATDFLEYLATDPETRIISMYLEGIKDGRRLLDLCRQLSPVKPVIIWKGGLTDSGARAAVSHTGSLAGDRQIWDAFFKQTGAISVSSIEEIAEITMTLLHLKPSQGRRAVVLSSGGGNNVATGDICAEEGLDVPALSQQTIAKLREFVSLVNQGIMNPLDVPAVLANVSRLERALTVLAAEPQIDIIIIHMGAEFLAWPLAGAIPEFKKCILDMNQKEGGKTTVVAMCEEYRHEHTEKYARELRNSGIVAFGSLRRACRALNRFAGYHEFITKSGE